MGKKLAFAAILAGMVLVAGCKQHREPPVENEPVEVPAPAAPPEPAPPPAARPKPAAAKPRPAPPTSAEQQVLDDADATGMTSRVDRSGDNNETQAAENREQ